ncbi:hypothetical protein EV641_109174 [Rhodococcus sp. SMB37]|uniref:hypothetical protein n=1 Tax=Rhodococcus sp. SMB37 TaxID=2512213 RepID=UPI0010535D71|nr:hypothetical protein [Rhodococcus sp. SMB37]TCN51783.1 hypothetical protein EV641_109174 [Rhodococcus sp. SMB37]
MTAFSDDPAKIARDEADLAERKRKLGLEKSDAPEVIDLDESGEVAPAASAVAVAEKEPWAHELLTDFYGEDWEVRKPTEQALAGFALAAGKYVPQKLQNDLVGLFIRNHMSEESHEHMYERLMDPDDASFTPATLGEMMREIALLGRDELKSVES